MDKLIAEGLALLCRDSETAAGLIGPRRSVIADLLDRYAAEIERFNPLYGLVRVKDREELVTRHIFDSLAPLGHIAALLGLRRQNRGPQLADAGSGAGLPGIPLAICLPGVPVTLIERMGRRANFLRNTLAVLGLSSVTVEETEMERFPPGRFKVVTFRAFHPLERTLLHSLFRLLAPAGPSGPGVLAAYKGRREKLAAELEAASCTAEIIPLSVPFLKEERHLALIRDET
ncbi:MAG: 16S rRNA (guanine(527)-N(7))-methyltransferase RsmG [Treponema sp.]|jgi:16S rRNA (guanine527-N7)-methyltransferase|nr:16S rRNA (guanine(527)-N(7))-methyltransferase RsmG [Treponema sp.]